MNELPIAEEFSSIQGEGFWTGTPMRFVRLAGCSVGLYQKARAPNLLTGKQAWECHTHDGRAFWCDTDFNKRYIRTPEDLLHAITETHLCITGGEPLIHNLEPLINAAVDRSIHVHIETSGTIELPSIWKRIWYTVSPKLGVLESVVKRADEIKLLVDEHFNLLKIPWFIEQHELVYLQPINGEREINQENVKRCLRILETYPNWRLSLQIQKVIGVR
jgi:organic radical activating enzyme